MQVVYGKQLSRLLEEEKITHAELVDMIERSARCSMRGFNRRYHNWVFLLKGDVLERMEAAKVAEVGRGEDSMSEDCPRCEGLGCKACNWSGQVVRRVVDTTAIRLQQARMAW